MGDAYSAILVGNIVHHELGHVLDVGHADFDWIEEDGSWVRGDLMSTILPGNAETWEIPISPYDIGAFSVVHDWYPGEFEDPSEPSVPYP